MKKYMIALVEVGDRYVTRLVTTKADHCTMKEAQQIARSAGYQVIEDLCYIVPTTQEVHVVVAVEPEEEVE
jgi:bifunctional ADP-heptose synthase (sugar kinase/adenylyltransferase)